MKRFITTMTLLAGTVIGIGSASGQELPVRCIDAAGQVTLTNQACPAGSATVRHAALGDQLPPAPENTPMAVTTVILPPSLHSLLPAPGRRASSPPARQAAPLAPDVATIKAARARFLLERMEVAASSAGSN